MKNSEARPVGTAPLPGANEVERKDPNECNYVQNDKRSHGKGRGGYKGHGRDNYSNSRDNYSTDRKGNHNNRGRGSNYGRGRESLKNKNPEAHMVHDSGYEADNDSDIPKNDQMDFETSDCLKD
ncbi:uncharacterized protein LOC106355968 [Brassica napus]|uniref:uncharacterized protein LOC106355968 n=1 Tax=Brassica napus TaxID=3708 RepID=UPI0006AA73E4|nr:uncharacterized protein LOC106355968 [Brassica napus]